MALQDYFDQCARTSYTKADTRQMNRSNRRQIKHMLHDYDEDTDFYTPTKKKNWFAWESTKSRPYKILISFQRSFVGRPYEELHGAVIARTNKGSWQRRIALEGLKPSISWLDGVAHLWDGMFVDEEGIIRQGESYKRSPGPKWGPNLEEFVGVEPIYGDYLRKVIVQGVTLFWGEYCFGGYRQTVRLTPKECAFYHTLGSWQQHSITHHRSV